MTNSSWRINTLTPFKITLIYLVAAVLWIVFTDYLLEIGISETEALSQFQTYKGLFYIIITSAGLYLLIKKYARQIRSKEEELKGVESEHESDRELMDILFERIPVMITIYDPDLEEFEVNHEFEKVTGWSNVDAKEINVFEECYPDKDLQEEVLEFMNNPGIGWREFPLTTKSGETVDTSWTNVRLTDDTSVGIGIDMTETKASEARLRESRELLRNTFESLEESVILLEPETRTIKDCNKATDKIFGYSKEELIGQSTRMLHIDEQHYEDFDKMGEKALEEEGSFQTEFKMKKKSGEPFFSDHTVTLVYDEQGEVDRVVSVVRDITERKKNEKELVRRQKRLLRSQKIGKIGDWEFDPVSEGINWSPMMYEIYERDPELGPPGFDMIRSQYYVEESNKHNERVRRAIQKGEAYDIDLQLQTEKGNRKYIRTICRPEEDEKGKVIKLQGTVQDITERKEAEEQLKKSEEKYRFIFEKNPQPMWIVNSDTLEIMDANEEAVKHYGYSLKEFKTMKISDINIETDYEELQNLTNHTLYKYETVHKTKDGSSIDVEVSAANTDKNEDVFRIVLVNDVTEKKRAKEQVISSVIEGEDRERKRIARELHDGIGQYLSAANMNLEAMKKDIAQLSEKRKSQFSKGLDLLKQSITEIRDISHNLMPKAIEDYGLTIAVEAMVENYENSRNITIQFDSNIQEELLIEQEQLNIYRIIQESLHNAIKYAECEKVSVQLYQERNKIYLTIEDDGKGVNFYDVESKRGLGLKSIRSRTKALSGSIQFDSVPERGTVITLQVPIELNNTIT